MGLTEEGLRIGIANLRRETGQVAFCVAVGSEDRLLVGNLLGGIPVIEWNLPMTAGMYILLGVPVQEPGMACVELGVD